MSRKRNILLLLGLLALVVFLIIGLLVFSSDNSFSSSLRNAVGMKNEPKTKLIDVSGTEVPLDTYFDIVNGLVVSGIVKEVNLNNDPFIILETEVYSKRKTVKVTFPKTNSFLVLRLVEGKFGQTEEWRGNLVEDLRAEIEVGTQVIVHVRAQENEAKSVISSLALSNEQKEIGEAVRIVLPN